MGAKAEGGIYCFDSSAFIQLKNFYSGKTFNYISGGFEKDVQSGIIKSPKEVLHELRIGQDDLTRWAESRGKMIFVSEDEDQIAELGKVLARFPAMHDLKKRIYDADPLVVALAMSRKMAVVSGEIGNGMKICRVCKELDVRHFSLQQFLDARDYPKS